MDTQLQCYVALVQSNERVCCEGMFIVRVDGGRRSKQFFPADRPEDARAYVEQVANQGIPSSQVAALHRCLGALESGERIAIWS
jgi:hypothetical protein